MTKFFIGIIVGIIALLCFVYFGGAEYLNLISKKTDQAAVRVEKFQKKMQGMKKRAAKVKEKAEEAGKRIEKYIP